MGGLEQRRLLAAAHGRPSKERQRQATHVATQVEQSCAAWKRIRGGSAVRYMRSSSQRCNEPAGGIVARLGGQSGTWHSEVKAATAHRGKSNRLFEGKDASVNGGVCRCSRRTETDDGSRLRWSCSLFLPGPGFDEYGRRGENTKTPHRRRVRQMV